MSDGSQATCPYKSMDDQAYWSRSVARKSIDDVDPAIPAGFRIKPETKIATAGSCFAQHIARALQQQGFTYLVTEALPSFVPASVRSRWNYGTFSARYGNIYTARQLMQLLDRAYGNFHPRDVVWEHNGGFVDPYRPHIQPDGFKSQPDLLADQQQHFKAVRELIETCDVFVFTLGLTEAWQNKFDGAVYPVCPGCGAGVFDPSEHEFVNFGYMDILRDATAAFSFIREKNPNVRFILTVSPVPLIATATEDHVLTATTYSKSVLRAVAGDLAKSDDRIMYFPSYEIISSSYAKGRFFESDLRSVTADGVQKVMRSFIASMCDTENQVAAINDNETDAEESALRVICDEEQLEAWRR